MFGITDKIYINGSVILFYSGFSTKNIFQSVINLLQIGTNARFLQNVCMSNLEFKCRSDYDPAFKFKKAYII